MGPCLLHQAASSFRAGTVSPCTSCPLCCSFGAGYIVGTPWACAGEQVGDMFHPHIPQPSTCQEHHRPRRPPCDSSCLGACTLGPGPAAWKETGRCPTPRSSRLSAALPLPSPAPPYPGPSGFSLSSAPISHASSLSALLSAMSLISPLSLCLSPAIMQEPCQPYVSTM